jgi:hypothetical protein
MQFSYLFSPLFYLKNKFTGLKERDMGKEAPDGY